jgi:predicted dienelactone hydrolase
MSVDQHPEDQTPGAPSADGLPGLTPITRRQLVLGAAVLGASAAAAGSLLTSDALAGSEPGVGQVTPPGRTEDPWLGYPVPGDLRPDAPELAARGRYDVGVRGFTVVNPEQIDMATYSGTGAAATYDRPLPLMVWYPALRRGKTPELTTYKDYLGSGPGSAGTRPIVPFTFPGRAMRDARPDAAGAPYPLVIVSHGYPGSNVLLTNITENLASKGYVVVAIDHTDSTHADATSFASTLRNRMLDDNFVLQEMADLTTRRSKGSLSGLVDVEKIAILGYSMGGYGAVLAAGAGLSAGFLSWAPGYWKAGPYLDLLAAGGDEYRALLDPRVKALVLAGPWGGTYAWDAAGLAAIKVPTLCIVGDQDQTAPYAGAQAIYNGSVSSDRWMLVHQQGDHEVIANPAPPITFTNWREWVHYEEPALGNTRTNNINQHFITAFLDQALKGADYSSAAGDYLNPVYEYSNDSNRYDNPHYYDNYPASRFAPWPDCPIWRGFPIWSAVGLRLLHSAAS